MPDRFEPKIVAFFCNWCTYLAADLAGTSRMKYAPNTRVVRVMCSGRVDPQFVLDAFSNGADGVLIGGCLMLGPLAREPRSKCERVQDYIFSAQIFHLHGQTQNEQAMLNLVRQKFPEMLPSDTAKTRNKNGSLA